MNTKLKVIPKIREKVNDARKSIKTARKKS